VDAVRARLETYEAMTKPLLDYYGEKGKKLLHNFSGTESDVIYPQIKAFLEEEFSHLK
jgi:adenylate kinase family enzyme